MNKLQTTLAYIVFIVMVNYIGFSYFGFLEVEATPTTNYHEIDLPIPELRESVKWAKNDPEVICMAENLYHEARDQPIEGIIAVGFVTLNRVDHSYFPDTVCGVVYDPAQFSWTINPPPVLEDVAWSRMLNIAYDIMNDEYFNNMFGVLYYHNHDVNPSWTREKTVAYVIEDHIFYGSPY